MKIVILDAATVTRDDIDLSIFGQFGDVKIYDFTYHNQIAERVRDAEIILCNKSAMNKRTLSEAKNVKYIGLFATGYNNIDFEYTREHNITVCNAGSYSTEAVAQHVFALILNYYNRVPEYNQFVRDGSWTRSKLFSPFMPMHELYGRTIGIIGYGSIGSKVAQVSKAFGMNVLAYNRSKKEDKITEFVSMNELLEKSDIVTVHCPLNEQSERMCNKDFFNKMKKDAYFVNTSRGGIVDEEDLIDALNENIIAGAALDVITVEPMLKTCHLLDAKNITITPHAAWAPIETRSRLVGIVVENIKKWLAGTPVNVIE